MQPKRTLVFRNWTNTYGGNTVSPNTAICLRRGVDYLHDDGYRGITLPAGTALVSVGPAHLPGPMLRSNTDDSAEPWIIAAGAHCTVTGLALDCGNRPNINGIIAWDATGLTISDVTVQGCTVTRDVLRCPIRVVGRGEPLRGLTLRRVRIPGCGHTGIHLAGSIEGALLDECTVLDAATQQPGHGISLYSHGVRRGLFPAFEALGGTLYRCRLQELGIPDVRALYVRPVTPGPQLMALDPAAGPTLRPGEFRVSDGWLTLDCGVPLPTGPQQSVRVDACQQPITGTTIRRTTVRGTKDTRVPGVNNDTPEGVGIACDDFASHTLIEDCQLPDNNLAVSMNLGRNNTVARTRMHGNKAGAVAGVTRGALVVDCDIEGDTSATEFGSRALVGLIPPVTPASREPNTVRGGRISYTGRDQLALCVAGSPNVMAPTVQVEGTELVTGAGRAHGMGDGPDDGGFVFMRR